MFNTQRKKSQFESQEYKDKAADYIRDWQHLFGLRGNWNNHWTEIAQRILPMDSYLFQNYSQLSSQGEKRNFELYDSTGLTALKRFGALLDSLLTPRDQFWHIIVANDPVLMKDRGTRMYFDILNQRLFDYRYNPKANFAANNQWQYISLGAYGTGVMFIDALAGADRGVRYKTCHLGENYIQENHQGLIDSNCRHFMLTARQAYQKFGDDCPEQIRATWKIRPEEPFYFLHWVRPNLDRDPERIDHKGMAYESCYISIMGSQIVYENGYRSFPYAISRYYQAANETYGRSIAMDVLPELKTLNEQYKTMLKQGHRAVDPVLLAHDDGVIDGFNLSPGAINPGGISEDGRLLVQPLPTGSVEFGEKQMDQSRQVINDAFLVSLFQSLVVDAPMKTAAQVYEEIREKGILVAPTIGRQNSEYLAPLIEREIDILNQQGALPPMPKLLASAQGQYKITFKSPITRLQEAEYTAGAMRTIQMLLEYATAAQDSSVLDILDMDTAGPDIARSNGTPEKWFRDEKALQMVRQQKAQQKATQQQIEAAPAIAGMMKAHAAAGSTPFAPPMVPGRK